MREKRHSRVENLWYVCVGVNFFVIRGSKEMGLWLFIY